MRSTRSKKSKSSSQEKEKVVASSPQTPVSQPADAEGDAAPGSDSEEKPAAADSSKDICPACPDQEKADEAATNKEDWIRCDACKTWYHWRCVGNGQELEAIDKWYVFQPTVSYPRSLGKYVCECLVGSATHACLQTPSESSLTNRPLASHHERSLSMTTPISTPSEAPLHASAPTRPNGWMPWRSVLQLATHIRVCKVLNSRLNGSRMMRMR